MFKKSTIYLIILIVLISVFSTENVYASEIGIDISSYIYHPVRSLQEALEASMRRDAAAQQALVSADSEGRGARLENENSGTMAVSFLDVGQADSIFIDFGSCEILVDGGNSNDSKFIADYINPYVDGALDLIIGTHAHEDHIGGLSGIINAYPVDTIIYSDETSTCTSFLNFCSAAINKQNCCFKGDSDMTFDMGGGAEFRIMEMGDGFMDCNDNSVVSMIDYKDIEVLLMGDLGATVEKNNLDRFSDIDVLKVGHHGSRTATSQAFLEVIKPEASVISAGLANQYLLPGSAVITRLQLMNSAVYGTFRSGTIVMTTDGIRYSFSTDTQLTSSDAGARGTEIGAVYIGNSGTLKFHTLECDAGSKIADRNAVYLKDRNEAISQGYVPCKLCNP